MHQHLPPALSSRYLDQLPHPDPAVEIVRGARPYLSVLAELHELFAPRTYLEIGVRRGSSLALARCPALAIDPYPELAATPPQVDLHCCTSDAFFRERKDRVIGDRRFDLAFIDGMHLAEYALRDFINVEAVMAPGGIVIIDDIFPNHPVQAIRERQSQVWTGDVWRLGALLQKRRPGLNLTWLDTAPTGLLVVTGLDPANHTLARHYIQDLRVWASSAEPPPEEVLQRAHAIEPSRNNLLGILGKRVTPSSLVDLNSTARANPARSGCGAPLPFQRKRYPND